MSSVSFEAAHSEVTPILSGVEGQGGPAEGTRGAALARYGAVFLVMMSNLMLELLLTRIFSATMWYHFAFMAVSVALFGTTVGAVAVYLWPGHFAAERAWRVAGRYGVLYAAAIVVCTALQLRLDVTFGYSPQELATLALLYVLVAVPFTLSGIFICLALLRAEDRLGGVYAADLLGAAAGCALFVPLMAHGDGPRTALALAALAAVGAGLMALAAADRQTLAVAGATAALSVLAFVTHLDGHALHVRWAKGSVDGAHAFESWNAFSRLWVDPVSTNPFGWGLSARFPRQAAPVAQKALAIDGGALTVLTGFNGDLRTVGHLSWDVTSLAYALRSDGSVLVIGVGGGRDLLAALAAGSRRVVGVEVNADILGLLRGEFADFTGHLADRADVELVHDEARSYAARTRERFDVVQAALVDTWAAAANGAYVLSENALYTQEAFQRFLDRLKPDGILSFSRWYFSAQPGETLRLVSLASTVLRHRGVPRPQEHLFLARSGATASSVATLLIAARPFTAAELSLLRQWCAAKGFEELLGPGTAASDVLAQLAGPEEPVALLASFPIDLSAPVDDRPFFFNMLRLRHALGGVRDQADAVRANATAVVMLVWLLVLVVVLSAAFIVVPLWWRGAADGVASAAARLAYFTGLGLGFILIEISQMQRLMIALGHPVYGLTVVLFSLLVAAGLGSWWTERSVRRGSAAPVLPRALLALLLVAGATAAGGTMAAPILEVAPAAWRIAGSVLLLVPLGFLLGMPLPLGLALSAGDPPGYRALYWGANGAASVCGSVVAMMLSLTCGILGTYLIGMAVYGLCTVIARRAFAANRDTHVTG
jgi:SAM-dependent methyltransferase